MWLVVNPNGEFRVFTTYSQPYRIKVEIMKPGDTLEEDYHGHFYRPDVGTGEFIDMWGRKEGDRIDKGYKINPKYLSPDLLDMTWDNEPLEIGDYIG